MSLTLIWPEGLPSLDIDLAIVYQKLLSHHSSIKVPIESVLLTSLGFVNRSIALSGMFSFLLARDCTLPTQRGVRVVLLLIVLTPSLSRCFTPKKAILGSDILAILISIFGSFLNILFTTSGRKSEMIT